MAPRILECVNSSAAGNRRVKQKSWSSKKLRAPVLVQMRGPFAHVAQQVFGQRVCTLPVQRLFASTSARSFPTGHEPNGAAQSITVAEALMLWNMELEYGAHSAIAVTVVSVQVVSWH